MAVQVPQQCRACLDNILEAVVRTSHSSASPAVSPTSDTPVDCSMNGAVVAKEPSSAEHSVESTRTNKPPKATISPLGRPDATTFSPQTGAVAQLGWAKPGWTVEAELDSSGTLLVRWTAPRPILEVKVGVGFHVTCIGGDNGVDVDHGTNYTTKIRSRPNDPQPAGNIAFSASVAKRFISNSAPAVAAVWDLDMQPALPVCWSSPFILLGKHEGESVLVPQNISRCDTSQSITHESNSASSVRAHRRDSNKRKIGIDKLNRSGVRRLLKLLKSNSDTGIRVLRLKQYLDADANPMIIDTVLDALANNTVVEALYIQVCT